MSADEFRYRPDPTYSSLPELAQSFKLSKLSRNYAAQFSNVYFSRLFELRQPATQKATEKWSGIKGRPKLVERVLDVQKDQLCYIVGTIYMDMPLKPNVLEDISKDKWITAPPPRIKYFSDEDETMLEDESGRVRLVGDRVKSVNLVTGVITAVLGYESSAGDFEVVDLCFAGIPPHADPSDEFRLAKVHANEQMDVDGDEPSKPKGAWVALVSGLEVSGEDEKTVDLKMTLLVEWLMGELGSEADQELAGSVCRLIIAGNSLLTTIRPVDPTKSRVYGYDSSTYSTLPITTLDTLLSSLSPLLPIHLLPGASDPAGVTLPQQPLPRLMFAKTSKSKGFRTETNPCWMEVGGRTMLGTGGQPLEDVFKYVEEEEVLGGAADDGAVNGDANGKGKGKVEVEGNEEGKKGKRKGVSRLEMASQTLEWRHMAPTAPDTLWCHPFDEDDPFILKHAPDIYFIGNQPRFESSLVNNSLDQPTRVILLPKFSQSGTLVLVNTETLDVRTIDFEIPSWQGDLP